MHADISNLIEIPKPFGIVFVRVAAAWVGLLCALSKWSTPFLAKIRSGIIVSKIVFLLPSLLAPELTSGFLPMQVQ